MTSEANQKDQVSAHRDYHNRIVWTDWCGREWRTTTQGDGAWVWNDVTKMWDQVVGTNQKVAKVERFKSQEAKRKAKA